MTSPTRTALALLASALLLAGCPREATQVLVHFEVDPDTSTRARSIRVRLESQDQDVRMDRTVDLGDGPPLVRLPTTVPVSPQGDDAARVFRIEGELRDGEQLVVSEQRATVGFVKHQRFEVHLRFDDECLGRFDCSRDQTCRDGICVDAYVPRPGEEVDAGTSGVCPEDPCKILPPQCGCPPGQACQRPGMPACGIPGPQGLGEYCEGGNAALQCNGGLTCWGITTRPGGSCRDFCTSSEDCRGSFCLGTPAAPAGVCLPTCNPLDHIGCPERTICVITSGPAIEDGTTRVGTTCFAPGPGREGDACTGTSCGAGLGCVSSVCRTMCRVGEDDCSAGRSCFGISLGGVPAVVQGVSYGICG